MRLIILRCGHPNLLGAELAPLLEGLAPTDVTEVHELSAVPTRKELRVIDDAAKDILPHDPTPSLDEISAQPDVEHLGTPKLAPQRPDEELRIVVIGDDAALSAVLTRMMRADYLWAAVGYVHVDSKSLAATTWALPESPAEALELAVRGRVRPVPTIRTDTSLVVAGGAAITSWEGRVLDGEVIVDNETLLAQLEKVPDARFYGQFGVRLVPMSDAPGIAAVLMTTPAAAPDGDRGGRGLRGALGRWMANSMTPTQVQSWSETPGLAWLVDKAPVSTGGVDTRSLATGRAVQAGGNDLRVSVDGISAPRPTKRVTFYRHLRDTQIVRP